MIYCHTHTDSGRRYIGLTKKTMMQRWNQHVAKSKSLRGKGCFYFWNAIRKYGKDAFSHEVLEVCETLEEANLAEQKWIDHFDSKNPEKGFNLAEGGEHIPHPIRKNPWDDPEYREKAIRSLKEMFADPAEKQRRSFISKQTHSRPEVKIKSSLASRNMWGRSSYREKQKVWSNTREFKEKCISNLISASNRRRLRTHCKNGHEFTLENTLVSKRGRICRECHNNDNTSYYTKFSLEQLEARRKQARDRMRKKRADSRLLMASGNAL